MDFNLSIYEYCAEDSSYTVQGQLNNPPDLKTLSRIAKNKFDRVIHMEELNALVIISGESTIHIHPDGELAVNGVSSEEAAEQLLEQLFDA